MARKIITDEALVEAVANSKSFTQVLSLLGIKMAGGSHSHYTNRVKKLGIDISHFCGHSWNKGKKFPPKRSAKDILVLRTEGRRAYSKDLVRALLEIGREHVCSKCQQGTEWLGNKLTLDVDHINENWLDDREDNLRFLCPNCHSQFSRNLIE